MEPKKAAVMVDGKKVAEVIAQWDGFQFTGVNGYVFNRNDMPTSSKAIRSDALFYAKYYTRSDNVTIGRFSKVRYL